MQLAGLITRAKRSHCMSHAVAECVIPVLVRCGTSGRVMNAAMLAARAVDLRSAAL